MSNLICTAASWLGVGLDRCQPANNKAGETKPKPAAVSVAEDPAGRSFLEALLFGTSTAGGAVGCGGAGVPSAARVDAGRDGGIDAGQDTGKDAEVDIGRSDAGKAGKPESISCGTDACEAQIEVCCTEVLSGEGPVCIDAQDPCGGTVTVCDGPEDCTDAVCCAEVAFEVDIARREGNLNGSTECTPTCNFAFDFNPLTGQGEVTARACHNSDDCTTTEPVCCETPGIDTGMCLTTSAAALAEEYTYGLMDCN